MWPLSLLCQCLSNTHIHSHTLRDRDRDRDRQRGRETYKQKGNHASRMGNEMDGNVPRNWLKSFLDDNVTHFLTFVSSSSKVKTFFYVKVKCIIKTGMEIWNDRKGRIIEQERKIDNLESDAQVNPCCWKAFFLISGVRFLLRDFKSSFSLKILFQVF